MVRWSAWMAHCVSTIRLCSLKRLSSCHLSRRKRYQVRPRSPLAASPPDDVPGVSIIRPLKGLDAELYANLESTFKQDYPKFEVLLAVADEDDPALPVIRDLVAQNPAIDASIVIGCYHLL